MARLFTAFMALALFPFAASALEVGANDFRISFMGPDGSGDYRAGNPRAVFNPTSNEFYVVWRADDETAPLVNNEFEIFGQRLDADTGEPIGSETRLSFQGPESDPNYSANDPAVAYNATDNQYLVVWAGDDDDGPLVVNEQEIYGQRVDADGALAGINFRISFMTPDGDDSIDASISAVAYNSTDNEYLVVWTGESDDPPIDGDGIEIVGQRVSAAGTLEAGPIQISDMGDAVAGFGGFGPDVSYNAEDNEYLVVWYGDDNIAPLGNNEVEIFGQRLNAATGAPVGDNDFRISEAGGADGNNTRRALNPSVVWNPDENQYLVAWTGEKVDAPFVDEEYEVFGQILAADGTTVTDDFRISSMGPDGNVNYTASGPDTAYSPVARQYLVTWRGDDDRDPLVDDEHETFGLFLSPEGAEVDPDDFRISDMGPDQSSVFGVTNTAVAADSRNFRFLAVWTGDDNTSPLVDGENEVFGQFLVPEGCGNGVVESGEDCDDGNIDSSDGCSDACTDEGGSTSGSTTGSTGGTAGTAGTSGSGDSGGGCSLTRER